ncbi:MAG: hemolysin family protein [Acidimicrobiia bacterium]
MEGLGLQLTLVGVLLLINGILAGSEIALISLREAQINRLEAGSTTGRRLAELARDPNRYLATIQIGITLSGFLASATAAVALAEPLIPYLGFAGDAARSLAIILVTLVLSFVTLVIGELAPKRLALQRAESWSMFVARPLHWASVISRPLVWLLSRSTDFVVRLLGGEPEQTREVVEVEELRELLIAHHSLSEDHQEVLAGAFEVAERTVRQVLVPRSEVVVIDADDEVAEALTLLLDEGHSRAPVAPQKDLDETLGIAHLRDLVAADPAGNVSTLATEPVQLPETVPVLVGLRRLQEERQQMALVVDEYGGVEGIVTVEDLIEELVGEIYDETDADLISVQHRDDGSLVVPGNFPAHDLPDLGVYVRKGHQTTVAGLVLAELARLPKEPGDVVIVGRWRFRVTGVEGNRITSVTIDAAPRKR